MKKKTHDEFVSEVKDSRGDIFEFLSEYKNARVKIKVRCKICGKEYNADPRQLASGHAKGCKFCNYTKNGHINGLKNGKPRKYNYSTAKKIIESTKEYLLLSDSYRSVTTHLIIQHKKCGNQYQVTLDKFMQGCRCPFCCRNPIVNSKIFAERIQPEYKLIGEYINAKTPVSVLHNRCGNIISVIPDGIARSPHCPYCNQSKGERKVEDYLKEHGYLYQKEFSFDDLKSKNHVALRYDFAVAVSNKLLLIEYDGEFHFEKYYNDQNFDIQKEHDEAKNIYAFEHNIPLLRIPYYDFDKIDTILEVFFKKYA